MPTSNCLNGRDLFSYLNGSASQPNKAQIEKHLNLCDHCFEVFIYSFNDFLNEPANLQEHAAPFAGQYQYA